MSLRHLAEMAEREINAFLTPLAVEDKVARPNGNEIFAGCVGRQNMTVYSSCP